MDLYEVGGFEVVEEAARDPLAAPHDLLGVVLQGMVQHFQTPEYRLDQTESGRWFYAWKIAVYVSVNRLIDFSCVIPNSTFFMHQIKQPTNSTHDRLSAKCM